MAHFECLIYSSENGTFWKTGDFNKGREKLCFWHFFVMFNSAICMLIFDFFVMNKDSKLLSTQLISNVLIPFEDSDGDMKSQKRLIIVFLAPIIN